MPIPSEEQCSAVPNRKSGSVASPLKNGWKTTQKTSCCGDKNFPTMMEKPKKKTARGGSQTMFPGRLHDLLEYVESQGLDHIVSWVNNGNAFLVHKQDDFLRLLSFFFGQTKFRSFTRQLNMWHFERENLGLFKGAWKHPYFKKEYKELCDKMSRQEPPQRELRTPLGIVDARIQPLQTRLSPNLTSLNGKVKLTESLTFPGAGMGFGTLQEQQVTPSSSSLFHASSTTSQHAEIPLQDTSSLVNHFLSNDFAFGRQMVSHPPMDDSCSTDMVGAYFAMRTPLQEQHWAAPLPWGGDEQDITSTRIFEETKVQTNVMVPVLDDSLFFLEAGVDALEPKPIAEFPSTSSHLEMRSPHGTRSLEDLIGDDDTRYLLGLLSQK